MEFEFLDGITFRKFVCLFFVTEINRTKMNLGFNTAIGCIISYSVPFSI